MIFIIVSIPKTMVGWTGLKMVLLQVPSYGYRIEAIQIKILSKERPLLKHDPTVR